MMKQILSKQRICVKEFNWHLWAFPIFFHLSWDCHMWHLLQDCGDVLIALPRDETTEGLQLLQLHQESEIKQFHWKFCCSFLTFLEKLSFEFKSWWEGRSNFLPYFFFFSLSDQPVASRSLRYSWQTSSKRFFIGQVESLMGSWWWKL